jgi:hypothetical protein
MDERKPEFGDSVKYIDGSRVLDATIMVAFADGCVHLRVIDPENPWGYSDVKRPRYDVEKHPGTYHFSED